ncbi:ABC transporter ATP-binding protein [Paenibacillus filicis]|uniref:ABC transporter ATP-binding protein n=1 Tax=Paenibacillus filicis TaxID=669464 RepID=A0ABU9DQV5_9BACL
MSSNLVISIKNISKFYKFFSSPTERLKQVFVKDNTAQNNKVFRALNNISFQVEKGEMLGIIGRNGSGKSTLLQIIAGTLTPSEGDIVVNGKVAALLELGSGFNPDFTGHENIYLNASIFGLSKVETDRLYDQIISFADIGEFINQPIKTYSSGMFVRLAFSVAIHMNPEILIVDEALAVGDVFFQRKCFEKIKELNQNGCTLIYVTHELANLKQIVNRAILLDKGTLLYDGSPVEAVNKFYKKVYSAESIETQDATKKSIVTSDKKKVEGISIELTDRERYGNQDVVLSNVFLNTESATILSGQQVQIKLMCMAKKEIASLVFGVRVKTTSGIDVYAFNTRDEHILFDTLTQNQNFELNLDFDSFNLIAGEYFVSLALGGQTGDVYEPYDHRIDCFYLKIVESGKATGIANLKNKITLQ